MIRVSEKSTLNPTVIAHDAIASGASATVTIDLAKTYVVSVARKYQFQTDEELDVFKVVKGVVTQILTSPSGSQSCSLSGTTLTITNGASGSYSDYAVVQID